MSKASKYMDVRRIEETITNYLVDEHEAYQQLQAAKGGAR